MRRRRLGSLSVDTKKIDNKTFGKSASFITAHRCSPNTHAHTQIRARTHTQSCCRSFLLVFLVGCDFFVIIPRFRARLGLRRERAQSFPERLDLIGVKALRRKKKREKTARVRVGGRDVFRILRAVEERKSLNDDVFFDVVAFEPSIRARRLSREEGRRCGQERQQKVWTQKLPLETPRRLVIKSEVESHEERNRKNSDALGEILRQGSTLKKVMAANRGEIAVRIFRAGRSSNANDCDF